jgi:hypothetical protein
MTNRGIEIEYRTDTIFSEIFKDTTFVMDASNWNAFDYVTDTLINPGPTTYYNTAEGIRLDGQGQNKGLRLQTKSEMVIKDRTIYYKWKLHGLGGYSAAIPALKYNPLTNDGYYSQNQGVFFSHLSTGGTLQGSTQVDNDVWYYTRVKAVRGTNNYEAVTASQNYDNAGGVVILTKTVPVYTKSGYLSFMLYDNAYGNAYAILGELKIRKD